MKIEKIIIDEVTGSSITCYIQDVKDKYYFEKRAGIIIIPGGAYAYCSIREAEPVALKYLAAGYQAFVLNYTCRDKASWPKPLEEYEQAIQMIKKNAENFNLDANKIVTIGFSAGGHLAACTATIAKQKPNATILVYPVILRDIADLCMPDLPLPAEHVDRFTSPCFIVSARDDNTVNIKNALSFEMALAENCIPFESHIYSYGGHGFSIAEQMVESKRCCDRVPEWVEDSIKWLEEILGKLTQEGFSDANPKASKNGDTKPYLSVDCSLQYLMNKKEIGHIMSGFYEELDKVGFGLKVNRNTIINAFKYNTIRSLMNEIKFSDEMIEEYNEKLKQYENK